MRYPAHGRDVPDLAGVLPDGAVGRELAAPGDVQDRHARPALLVAVRLLDLVLAGTVGGEVGEDEVRVAAVQERVHHRPEQPLLTRREHAGGERVEHGLQPAVAAIDLPRIVAAPPERRTSSTVRPNRKKFSAPTSSRISTFAPSSVPIVSAR